MEEPILKISELYEKFEACNAELEGQIRGVAAQRDAAVRIAAVALDNYQKSIATTDNLLHALKRIAVINPGISGRTEV